MFATEDDVLSMTDYTTIDVVDLQAAQAVIEAYIGRSEAEVTDARDFENLRKATVFQAVYMENSPQLVYEQAAVAQMGHSQMVTTFKSGDFTAPWIAPLAVMACRNLSWMRSRSVHTGPITRALQLVGWDRA